MCDGSVASAGPPIALPLQQLLIQATPRSDPAPTGTPAPSAAGVQPIPQNPNLGRTVDLSA